MAVKKSLILLCFFIMCNLVSGDLYCYLSENCEYTPLLRLSRPFNAHGQMLSVIDGKYNYTVCCQEDSTYPLNLTTDDCTQQELLHLSDTTNAHGELGNITITDYVDNKICLGINEGKLECIYSDSGCSGYQACILSMSTHLSGRMTDLHLADCLTDPYATSICCSISYEECGNDKCDKLLGECLRDCPDCTADQCLEDEFCNAAIGEHCGNSVDCNCTVLQRCVADDANSTFNGCNERTCGDAICDIDLLECENGCTSDCNVTNCAADPACNLEIGENCQNTPTQCACEEGWSCEPENNKSISNGCYNPSCGNDVCDKDQNECIAGCSDCTLEDCLGDGECTFPGEDCVSSINDCACANDTICDPEYQYSDKTGCYLAKCGDNLCSSSESCMSCPLDCGSCFVVTPQDVNMSVILGEPFEIYITVSYNGTVAFDEHQMMVSTTYPQKQIMPKNVLPVGFDVSATFTLRITLVDMPATGISEGIIDVRDATSRKMIHQIPVKLFVTRPMTTPMPTVAPSATEVPMVTQVAEATLAPGATLIVGPTLVVSEAPGGPTLVAMATLSASETPNVTMAGMATPIQKIDSASVTPVPKVTVSALTTTPSKPQVTMVRPPGVTEISLPEADPICEEAKKLMDGLSEEELQMISDSDDLNSFLQDARKAFDGKNCAKSLSQMEKIKAATTPSSFFGTYAAIIIIIFVVILLAAGILIYNRHLEEKKKKNLTTTAFKGTTSYGQMQRR